NAALSTTAKISRPGTLRAINENDFERLSIVLITFAGRMRMSDSDFTGRDNFSRGWKVRTTP
ncbi:MAG TPA: hypothetical protein VHP99_01615, partial [Pyrinomonadaceae bacterium]|nr:hypothetical protein [Pyrinomonadaceae bacterium]